MTATLRQLSDNETQIYNEAGAQQRYTGVRVVNTSETWLFKDYKAIHNEYFELVLHSKDQEIKVEALKRMAFLNWEYGLDETYYNGITELDKTTIAKSYKIINEYIKQNKLDEEFIWMLSAYSCWDWIILQYSENKLVELTNFVKSVDQSALLSPKNVLRKGTMDNRGQMGIYWKPIVERKD